MIRRRSWSKTIQRWSERMLVIAGVIGIGWIAYIIATSLMPYVDDAPAAPIVCLDDINDVYINPDFTPWDELFPEGRGYGKDGEVIANSAADGMPFSEPVARPSQPMARMPWFYGGRILPGAQGGSIDKQSCAPSVVSEPKSWHLIIIGLLSFAVWRWVGKDK